MQKLKRFPLALMLVFTLSLAFTNCALLKEPVSWTAAYDAAMIQDVADFSKSIDEVFLRMVDAAEDERNYESCASDWNFLELQANNIVLKDQARPKNTEITKMAKNLQLLVVKFKTEHKNRLNITRGMANIYKTYLKDATTPLMVAETGLKQKVKK